MKRRIAIVTECVLAAIIVVACQANSTSNDTRPASANSNTATTETTAKTDRSAIAEEARALLTAHDKALSEKNLDAIMATFSTNPNTVVLGTGTEERWVGPQEIRAAYTEIIKDYDPNTLTATCDWKTGGADEAGAMAWFAASCTCKDSLQGKAREYKLNVTATAEKQEGKWKFVALHMSNAFQPPVTR